jgi:hypothetical protein
VTETKTKKLPGLRSKAADDTVTTLVIRYPGSVQLPIKETFCLMTLSTAKMNEKKNTDYWWNDSAHKTSTWNI